MPARRYHYTKKAYYGRVHLHPVEKELVDAHKKISERRTLKDQDLAAYESIGVTISEEEATK